MNNLTDRRFADIAKTSPALLAWWKKFEAVAPHLAARVASTTVLIGDELELPIRPQAPALISEERDFVWFETGNPSPKLFLASLIQCLWDLFQWRDHWFLVPFVARLFNGAIILENKELLRVAEKVAVASREGPAGLARIGIHMDQLPVQPSQTKWSGALNPHRSWN